MSNVLEQWLRENDEAITIRWTTIVQEYDLPHYQELSSQELQRDLAPFYECIASALLEGTAPAETRLEDWILGQRLYRQCTLGELLQIAAALKSAIWRVLAEGSDAYRTLQTWQTLEPLFDQATVSLATLFTQAIEQTLMDRLQDAEFMAKTLASATEEADRALQRMRMLYGVSRALAATLDLGEVLQTSASEMARSMNVDRVGIILFDTKQGVGTLVAEEPPRPDPQPPPLHFSLEDIPSLDEFLTTGLAMPLDQVQHTALLSKLRDMLLDWGACPLLLIPLTSRGQITGVLYLSTLIEDHSLQNDELQLAHTMANQIAVAIENAQFYQAVRDSEAVLGRRVLERTQELAQEKERVEFLYEIASETNASLDLPLVLERTLQLVTRAIGVQRGSIMLRDHETDHLVCQAAIGVGGTLDVGESMPFRMGEGLVGWVAQHREPAIVEDVMQDPRWISVPGRDIDYHSYIAVPIIAGDEVEGVLTLSHGKRRFFTEDHLRLLNAVTQEISSTIHNAALYRYVYAQADRLGDLLEVQEKDASKTRAILESIADAVVFSDAGGRIVLTNAAAERILGVHADQEHERHIRDLIQIVDLEDQATLQATLEGLMSSRTQDLRSLQPVRLTLQIGDLVANVHLSPVVIQTGEFLGVVMVFRDVTRETEVDRMKSEFISTVSHELRTPLTSIRGYVDIILDGDAGAISDETQEYLRIVKGNSNRLTGLINDLLDISQIEAGGRARFNLVSMDALALVEQAIARFKWLADEKGLTIQSRAPEKLPYIQVEPDEMAQLLDRLLSNAIKYTPSEGGQITISLSVLEQDSKIQFDIEDTGIGISPDDMEKLFTHFFRAEHPEVEFAGGTGLGLSIAKSIVEGHGGKIWAVSPGPSGHGSVFSFTIPLATETTSWAPVTLREAPAPRTMDGSRRLLVVDDNRDVVRLLSHRLTHAGYLVDTAYNGPAALARITEERPDLVLLDVLMPEMDGYKVLEQLKSDPTTANIPVIIISILEERERGHALGAVEYLIKPLDEQQLGRIISEVLGRTGLVLIADDDPDIVTLLQRTLQRRGFETRIATDGLSALTQAQVEPLPDLILLDLRMPKLDGYQVLEQLRSDTATQSIPVVIVTAVTPDQDAKKRRTKELGATRFISKPINMDALVAEVKQIVG